MFYAEFVLGLTLFSEFRFSLLFSESVTTAQPAEQLVQQHA